MTARWDYFVVFADMRTGSNFLEANINSFEGLTCHGEAFNGSFIGYPNTDHILGLTQSERDAEPARLIETIKLKTQGLGGFRYFSDHDPRALDLCLPDPRCAKIVLTRNPLHSYVSLKIARATGQWKLTNPKHARHQKIRFDASEFEQHLSDTRAFHRKLMEGLQKTGQTAYFVAYEDLQDVEVMNGLAAYLGCDSRIDALDQRLKRQNPQPLESKVANYDSMKDALAQRDPFDLDRVPVLEPRRGPNVPTYVAAPRAPLLFLPLKSGPNDVVMDWLSALDDGAAVITDFNQGSLRKWKTAMIGHRSFTVLRHPLSRAHAAFCDRILSTKTESYPEIRSILKKQFDVPLPAFDPFRDPNGGYDDAMHAACFRGFLAFLKKNLSGQTSVRVDPAWASQLSLLQGMTEFGVPDLVIREADLANDLGILVAQLGRTTMPAIPAVTDRHKAMLSRIWDRSLETMARDVFGRDYTAFGFGDWKQA